MQAVNASASAADTAMLLRSRGGYDNNVSKLSHLRRRNSRKFKTPCSNINLVVK
jgi:hypothetical protein